MTVKTAKGVPLAASTRILLPVTTLLAAAALIIGSGATFTSTSENPGGSFVTGTLTQSNSKANAAIFDMSNLKPGDSLSGSLTITNTGSLPASFSLSETATNGFVTPGNLTMTIVDAAAPSVNVFSGTFGTAGSIDLGEWAAGESHTYSFTVSLDQGASNAEQSKSATATYTWDSIQTAAADY